MTQAEAFKQLNTLRDAGYLIICWTPGEIEGVSDEGLNNIEDRLVTMGNDMIEELTQTDEGSMCTTCSGSGEGMYDGTRCRSCNGSGVEQ